MLVLSGYLGALKIKTSDLFNKTKWIPLTIIICQIILGILTVVRSPYGKEIVFFGVAHQLFAIFFLMSIIWMIFLVRKTNPASTQ